MDDPLLWAGIVACTALSALALSPLGGDRRLTVLTLALLIAPLLVLGDNWNAPRVVDLRESPAALVAALALAALAVGILARLFIARPGLLPLALIGTMPFRVPVELSGSTANLLLPLYLVLAAGLVAAWLRPRSFLRRPLPVSGPPALLAWALAAFLLVYGLQSGYSDEISPAVENIGFFLIPFAAILFLLASIEWDLRLIRAVVLVLAAEMLLVALVGFGQYLTGELFWNDKVISGNEAHAWFRVNSLFFDPNIMGRYLALTMVGLAAVAAWRPRREALWACVVFAVLLVALAITFSQSSFLALLAGLLALGLGRWGLPRAALASAAVVGALGLSLLVISGGGGDLAEETTGRTSLISGGLELAESRPLLGYGSASFADEFRGRFGAEEGIAVVSHTEPVTVAAEQGLVGLLPYAAVVLAGLLVLATAAGVGLGLASDPLAAAIGAAFVAMLVHSIGYAAFFIDPITWALFALAMVVPLRAPVSVPEPAALAG